MEKTISPQNEPIELKGYGHLWLDLIRLITWADTIQLDPLYRNTMKHTQVATVVQRFYSQDWSTIMPAQFINMVCKTL